jgi:NAD(P)-dependent dehydrogenase (short-subunit alcohol dehydrogenase family)
MKEEPMLDMRGKVAFVTGGGTGIGQAVAIGFAKAGAAVVVMGRYRPDRLDVRALGLRLQQRWDHRRYAAVARADR